MEQNKETSSKAGRMWLRLLAGVLAVLLAISLLLTNAIRISIQKTAEKGTQAAVTNYLYEHTDYAHLSTWERVEKIVGQLGRQTSLEDHYEKASIAIARGENEEALEHVDACLTLIDTESSVYTELMMKQGCLRALLQDTEGARESFAIVLEREPENAQAWLLQTQILIEQQDVTAAMEHLGAYLALEEGDASQIAVMAQLCFGAGEFENVLQYGEQALAMLEDDSEYGELYRCMGYAALMTEQMDKAGPYLTAAIERIEDNAEIYYYRGIYEMAQNRLKAALADYDTAIQNGYQTALAYYNRGVCSLALEDLDALRADMEKVAELDEDPELTLIAQEILKELE